MNPTKKVIVIILMLASAAAARAQVPQIINCQGRISVAGTNFDGAGQFKFALMNAAGSVTYWNNGVNPVSLTVTKGLYSVLLGDTNIPNMATAIPISVFANSSVWLRVWFNDGSSGLQQLSPDQRLGAAGYALQAASLLSTGDALAARLKIGTNQSLSGVWSSIAGGSANTVAAPYATIAGGQENEISFGSLPPTNAFIGGGFSNLVQSRWAAIVGGDKNTIADGAEHACIGGGALNYIHYEADQAVIAGGGYNSINDSDNCATIGGGSGNTIDRDTFYAVIAGGQSNYIGSSATCAMIPGGLFNNAGAYCFAAGRRAKANHTGSFVWADSQDADFGSTAANQVNFRCGGGVRFVSGTAGNYQTNSWTPGSGSWNIPSDRNSKEGFAAVNFQQVLEKVSRLPITQWNFRGYPQQHIGPMAQDFHALFPLNESDTTLNSADLDGVALAAIKGLYEVVKEKDGRIAELEKRLAELEARVQKLPDSGMK